MNLDELVQRLVKHGMPEAVARQRTEAALTSSSRIPLPTIEELDAMPDAPDITEAELEAMVDEDAARLVAEWRESIERF